MEFRILGSLEVVDDKGAGVAVGGSRERAVLALLLLSANRVVSSERLADDLWGNQPPDGAAHA
ncbi:MAG: winged helix-turn-helix domain-containing protein, partial [Actinobacteria bacterium]|nr:winged helix-turn-helix domain-containing protein [Actinomycetota bacterium]